MWYAIKVTVLEPELSSDNMIDLEGYDCMAWYDEAVFYHIYPLGLTGAPKTNDYGEPVHRQYQSL